MDKEPLSPELEQLIRKVRLKEPPEGLMADYLAGVNAKIDRGVSGSHFGFPQVTMVLAVGLVLAGLAYFYLARPKAQPISDIKATTVIAPQGLSRSYGKESINGIASAVPAGKADNDEDQISTSKPLSIEEEMAVLEAFSEEFGDETGDLFGDDETLEELGQLDEIELSPGLSAQPSGI